MSNQGTAEILYKTACWHLHTFHSSHFSIEWHHLSSAQTHSHNLPNRTFTMTSWYTHLCTNKPSSFHSLKLLTYNVEYQTFCHCTEKDGWCMIARYMSLIDHLNVLSFILSIFIFLKMATTECRYLCLCFLLAWWSITFFVIYCFPVWNAWIQDLMMIWYDKFLESL